MDRLVALVRDPQWIFGYWELSGGLLDGLRASRGSGLVEACAWVLRLHRLQEDLTVEMEIDPAAGNWYVHVGRSGRYQLELGLLTPDGEFIHLLASQVVETPAEGLSACIDEEWRMRPEDEDRLYRQWLEEGLLASEARRRGASGFLGASHRPGSWRLAGSLLGASWGGSFSGRPVAGSWAWSFLGASGRPSSAGSGGLANVGWLMGADGRHEALLQRPDREGGPNWNFQPNLPRRPSKTDAPHFKVKLPRVLKGVFPPRPNWPEVAPATPASKSRAPFRASPAGKSSRSPAPSSR